MADLRDQHEQAEELLPWYATGQLDAADRSLVEAHLAACARCQRQLAGERRMVEQFQPFSPQVASGWARMRQRIERESTRRGWFAGTLAEAWQILKRPAVAALAAAQVGILAIAAAIAPSLGGAPAYVALGERAQPAPSANVIILFRPEATEAGMRGALRQSGASLVGGPTEADAYLLSVPAAQRPAALAKLRGDRDVVMAEPIDGVAQ